MSLAALAVAIAACTGAADRSEERAASLPAVRNSPASSVLLVTLDTTRADHLGAYGSRTASTPQIDALAARGVLFERAYAVVPMTLPAHAAMMTGRLPARTGVRWNGEQRLAASPEDLPTLAERFRAAGYATAAFVSASVLDRAFGLDRGFDHYDDEVGKSSETTEIDWKAERPARETVARALAWLVSQPADRRVFLWVHLFDPHDPYRPPEPLATRFHDDPYSGEIAGADAALAPLLANDRFRPEAGSIVAVIGDHGEALGEHGEATHGILLHDATLHVPWILVAANLAPKRLSSAVSQVDLAPTLLHLAGLPPLAAPPELDGIDLVPEIVEGDSAGRGRTLYAESMYANVLYGWSQLRSARRGNYKLVEGSRSELFDFVTDPAETLDLHARLPTETGALARALATIDSRAGTGTAQADQAAPDAPAAVSEALAANLESLGYLSGRAHAAASGAKEDPRDRIALHEQLRAIEAQWRSGDFAGAQRALDGAFAADPDNLLVRGVLEQQLRRWLEAEKPNGEASVQQRAARAQALLRLATLALDDRRWLEAEQQARAAVALDPRNAAAHNALAIALDDLGRIGEAEAAYRAALAIEPSLFRSELNLALLLATEPGRTEEVAEHLRRFLSGAPANDPRVPEARAFLARISPGASSGG